MIKRRDFMVASAAIAATGTFNIRSTLAAEPQVMTAISNPGAMYLPYYVAEKAGFGKEQGLDLASIMIASGIGTRDAVVAGRAHFSQGAGNTAAQLTGKGRPARVVALVGNGAPNGNIVIRKDLFDQGIDTIEKFAAWKRPDGAKPLIVATSKGSGSYILGALTLTSYGVLNSFEWVFAGGGSSQVLALLKSKQADAIIANPNWQGSAVSDGFGAELFDILKPENTQRVFGGPFMNTVFYGLQQTLEDKALTQAYVNAIYRSMQWIKQHSEKEAWALLKDNYFSQLDEAITVNEMSVFKRVWQYDCFITPDLYERSRKLYSFPAYETPDLGYDEVVDMSFVQEAKRKFG